MPTFSILVPSYNHANFLPECLQSVLKQSLDDWEMILIDDKSTDNSLEIARSYTDERIQVHENESNLGTYATLNRALEMAKGKYIAVLNSDDYWDPQKLRKQLDLIEKNTPEQDVNPVLASLNSSLTHRKWSMCYTLGGWVDRNGTVVRSGHQGWPTNTVQDLLPYLVDQNLILASSLVFRRGATTFEQTMKYSGDWVMLLRLALMGPALCVSEPLTFWRQHENNTYTKAIEVRLEEIRVRQAIIDRCKQWLATTTDTEACYQGLARNALHPHALYVLFGDEKRAKKALHDAGGFDKKSPGLGKRKLLGFMPIGMQQQKLWPNEKPSAYRVAYVDRNVEPAPL